MERRSVLRTLGVGAGSAVAGCLVDRGRSAASVAAIKTAYPTAAAAQYYVHGEPVDEPDDPPVRFDSLSPQARLEVANGIARPQYVTSRSPEILDLEQPTVACQGEPFRTSVGITDGVRRRDPDVVDLVGLEATVSGSELELVLTNELEEPITISHYGRPYFGALVAVNGSTTLLHHDWYEENEAIRTRGTGTEIVSTDRFPSRDRTETLTPGVSLRESYRIRESPPDESVVWLSVPFESDTYRETLTARITLSVDA